MKSTGNIAVLSKHFLVCLAHKHEFGVGLTLYQSVAVGVFRKPVLKQVSVYFIFFWQYWLKKMTRSICYVPRKKDSVCFNHLSTGKKRNLKKHNHTTLKDKVLL